MGIDKFGRHHSVDKPRSDQMVIDKFGRHIGGGDIVTAISHPPQTFPFTPEGNYDAENRRICNVGSAREDMDCVNKKDIDNSKKDMMDELDRRIHGGVQYQSDMFRLSQNIDEATLKIKQLHNTLTDVQTNFTHLKKEVSTELTAIRNVNVTTSQLRLDLDNVEHILKLTDEHLTTNKSDVEKEIHHIKQRVHDIEQKQIKR